MRFDWNGAAFITISIVNIFRWAGSVCANTYYHCAPSSTSLLRFQPIKRRIVRQKWLLQGNWMAFMQGGWWRVRKREKWSSPHAISDQRTKPTTPTAAGVIQWKHFSYWIETTKAFHKEKYHDYTSLQENSVRSVVSVWWISLFGNINTYFVSNDFIIATIFSSFSIDAMQITLYLFLHHILFAFSF